MPTFPYPGGLSELEFVDEYQRSALRKPQVVADAIFKTMLYADESDRSLLCGAIAVELSEACRRLVAVYAALSNRRNPIAITLLQPLPKVQAWLDFAQVAGTFTPEQMLRELSLPDSAIESAELLRSQPDLGAMSDIVAAADMGSEMIMVPARQHSPQKEAWVAGRTIDGNGVTAGIPVSEDYAAVLADTTASLVSIARGFLGGYLSARRNAGRRE